MKNSTRRILTVAALLAFAFTEAHAVSLAANFGDITIGKCAIPEAMVGASLLSGLKNSFFGIAVLPAPVPEPATYATIFGLATFGFVVIRRRRR